MLLGAAAATAVSKILNLAYMKVQKFFRDIPQTLVIDDRKEMYMKEKAIRGKLFSTQLIYWAQTQKPPEKTRLILAGHLLRIFIHIT
jgi:hypothetical protein